MLGTKPICDLNAFARSERFLRVNAYAELLLWACDDRELIWLDWPAPPKGFNHGTCEAKPWEDSLTGMRGRWGYFDNGKWRLFRNRADRDIVARHLTSSC